MKVLIPILKDSSVNTIKAISKIADLYFKVFEPRIIPKAYNKI